MKKTHPVTQDYFQTPSAYRAWIRVRGFDGERWPGQGGGARSTARGRVLLSYLQVRFPRAPFRGPAIPASGAANLLGVSRWSEDLAQLCSFANQYALVQFLNVFSNSPQLFF